MFSFKHEQAANSYQMTNAHTTVIAQHRKLLFWAAFGINLDGTAIADKSLLLERLKVNKLVKTVEQYNYIIHAKEESAAIYYNFQYSKLRVTCKA